MAVVRVVVPICVNITANAKKATAGYLARENLVMTAVMSVKLTTPDTDPIGAPCHGWQGWGCLV